MALPELDVVVTSSWILRQHVAKMYIRHTLRLDLGQSSADALALLDRPLTADALTLLDRPLTLSRF